MPAPNRSEWKNLINKTMDDAMFATPASIDDVEAAEDVLLIEFPAELRALLLEFNGLIVDEQSELIWSCNDIQENNLAMRNEVSFSAAYKPFDHLLFFGADDNGDQFAYCIGANGKVDEKEIYRWNRETDRRTVYAFGLREFFESWSSKINDEEDQYSEED